MKKKYIAMILAIIVCFTFWAGTASAATEDKEVEPARAAISISSSLTKVSGTSNTYKATGTVTAGKTEDLSVYVYLYNSSNVLVGSAYNLKEGIRVSTSFNRALTSGRYKLVVYGYGDTDNYSVTKYYTI